LWKYTPISEFFKANGKKKEEEKTKTGAVTEEDEGHEEIYFRMFKPKKRRAIFMDAMNSSRYHAESGDIIDHSDDELIDYEDDLTETQSVASSVQTNSTLPKVKEWKLRYKLYPQRHHQ